MLRGILRRNGRARRAQPRRRQPLRRRARQPRGRHQLRRRARLPCLLCLHRPGYRNMGAARRVVLRALRRSAPRALQRHACPRWAVPGASDSRGRTDARRYGHSGRSRDAARRDMRDVLHRRADGQLRALLQREAPQQAQRQQGQALRHDDLHRALLRSFKGKGFPRRRFNVYNKRVGKIRRRRVG